MADRYIVVPQRRTGKQMIFQNCEPHQATHHAVRDTRGGLVVHRYDKKALAEQVAQTKNKGKERMPRNYKLGKRMGEKIA